MKDKFPHLMRMTPTDLHNYLMDRFEGERQANVRQHIYDTVLAQQNRKRNAKRQRHQVMTAWQTILMQAQIERRTVRSALGYDSGDAERTEAFEAYLAVIHKTLDLIRDYKRQGLTPKGVQEKRKKDNQTQYPNDLTHWSDLVPDKVQRAIKDAFASLDYKPKARRKQPFKRTESVEHDVPPQQGESDEKF